MHKSSLDKMVSFRDRYLAERKGDVLLILDLGSLDANGSYRQLFAVPPWRYLGVDIARGDNVDIVVRNPYCWKEIMANSADVLISGQAFEHIEFFWITMLEIERVLKPGGLCCIIAPSAGHEHRYPVDCWRFYPDGFRALARFARLQTIEVLRQVEPDHRFDDESNVWQDTMLVCRKPVGSCSLRWWHQLRRWILHRALVVGCK